MRKQKIDLFYKIYNENKQTNQMPLFDKIRLFIHNIELAEDFEPHSFRLSIKQQQPNNSIQTPIIYVENFQCQKNFPWQFDLSLQSQPLKIDLIQLSQKNNTNIPQGDCVIQLQEINDSDAIITNKQNDIEICKITFSLQSLVDPNNSKDLKKQSACQIQQNQLLEHNQFDQIAKDLVQIKNTMEKILTVNNRINHHHKIEPIEEQEEEQNQKMIEVDFLQEVSLCEEFNIWYQSQFSQQKPKQTKKFYNSELLNNKKLELALKLPKIDQNADKIIINQLEFIGNFQPKSIEMTDESNSEPMVTIQSIVGKGNIWEKVIVLPVVARLYATITGDNQTKYKCIIPFHQLMQINSILFDDKGQISGLLIIKYRVVRGQSVQTNDVLITISQTQETDKLNGTHQKDKQQNSHRRRSISNLETDDISLIKMNKLKLPMKIRTRKISEFSSIGSQQQKIQKKNTRNLIEPSLFQKAAFAEQKKQIMINKAEESLTKKLDLKYGKKNNQSIYASSSFFMKKNISQPQNKYVMPKLRVNSINSMPRKISVRSQKIHNINKSRVNSSITTERDKACFQIFCLKVQLFEDFDPFVGKFLTLQIDQQEKFTTETISLSKNLVWKTKSYSFVNYSIFSQLLISLFLCNGDAPILYGSTRICLALLNLETEGKTIHYQDSIRNEEMKQIGLLNLSYESLSGSDNQNKHKRVLTEIPKKQKKQIRYEIPQKSFSLALAYQKLTNPANQSSNEELKASMSSKIQSSKKNKSYFLPQIHKF